MTDTLAASPAQLEQLEKEGYTVFPQFLDRATTKRIRDHIDSLTPPVEPLDNSSARRLHILRHPIPGSIMADILSNPYLLSLAQQILKANELRLMEQVLIRTDGQAARHGADGWHIDQAFFPSHYNAVPRQTYYHMVHSLNTVPPGGGAFTIVPGSHHRTYAATADLSNEEELSQFPQQNVIEKARIDVTRAIEVLPGEGDLLVFNPMTLHSASHNVTSQPRYVYFASFCDISAKYLLWRLNEKNIRAHFPHLLRDNLPSNLQFLLEP